MPEDQSGFQGAFIPITDVYDVEVIQSLEIDSFEFREFLVRLRQSTNNIAIAVNYRDAGFYVQQIFTCGQLFFPNPALSSSTGETPQYRSVYRMTVNFGALPNNATRSVPHNITNIDANCVFTRIYATATDPVALLAFPIPNTFVAGDDITSIQVDMTNVNITTNWNASGYTQCVAIIEFFKG
jgi:hypothetical protein